MVREDSKVVRYLARPELFGHVFYFTPHYHDRLKHLVHLEIAIDACLHGLSDSLRLHNSNLSFLLDRDMPDIKVI